MPVLDVEDGDQHEEQRERQFGEDLVHFLRRLGPGIVQADTQKDRQEHQDEVLLDEVSHGQGDAHALPHQPGGPAHDDRDRK